MFAPGDMQPAPPQGQVSPPEPEAPKKFSSPGTTALGRSQFIPDSFVRAEPYEQVRFIFHKLKIIEDSDFCELKS